MSSRAAVKNSNDKISNLNNFISCKPEITCTQLKCCFELSLFIHKPSRKEIKAMLSPWKKITEPAIKLSKIIAKVLIPVVFHPNLPPWNSLTICGPFHPWRYTWENHPTCLPSCLATLTDLANIQSFSSFLRKPTSRLDPISEPASYNTCKGLNGVMSTLSGVPSKSFSKRLRGCW